MTAPDRMSFPIDLDLNPAEIGRLQTGPLIGRGTFGLVFRGSWHGETVAIKQIVGENERKTFSQEVAHLCRVDHPNIIKCYGYSLQRVLLVVEYAEDGSLHQLLHHPRYRAAHYNLAHALHWALQCAHGVQHLHSMKPKPIVHRDLKPLNLLLVNRGQTIKICDFGTACAVHTNMTVAQGSVAWMAPEVFQGLNYTEKCDIFSWAVTLWQVLARQIPYFNLDSPARPEVQTNNSSETSSTSPADSAAYGGGGAASFRIMWAVHSGERPQLLRGCPAVLEQLLQDCWDEQPAKRPSIDRVIEIVDPLVRLIGRWCAEPIHLPAETPEHDYLDSSTDRTNTASQSQYDLPEQIATEPPISDQSRVEVDVSITLPANVPFLRYDSAPKPSHHSNANQAHPPPPTSATTTTTNHTTTNANQTTSSTSGSSLASLDADQIETISQSNREKTQLHRQLLQHFATTSFEPGSTGSYSTCSTVSLTNGRSQPAADARHSQTLPQYSVQTEIQLHPAGAGRPQNAAAELSDFFCIQEARQLDPSLTFHDFREHWHPELMSGLHSYQKVYQDFVQLWSNPWRLDAQQHGLQLSRYRQELVQMRNSLKAQLHSVRRTQKQKEAADDGWEYLDINPKKS